MVIDSVFTKSFFTQSVTTKKYNFLHRKASRILEIKNSLASKMHEDPIFFLEHSKIDAIKYWNAVVQDAFNQDKLLSGQDIQNAIADTHTALQNRYEAVLPKIQFKLVNKITYCYYKKNTKNNNKGDLKEIKYKRISTPSTKIITYMARRRYSLQKLQYILNNQTDKDMILFFQDVISFLVKYGEERILNLATLKYKNATKHIKKPIVFKELTFKALDQSKSNIVAYNKNFNSKINSFIELNAQSEYKKLYLPVSFSKKYHKQHKLYGNKNTSYIIKLLGNNRIRVILTYKATRNIPVETELQQNNTMGVDVNVKHNLFSTSIGAEIDYDRGLFNDYVKFLKKLDNRKNKKLNKKQVKQKDKWDIRIHQMLKNKARELVNLVVANNKNHIVLEDLELMNSGFTRNNEFLGFKYSRLIRLLHLASLKTYIKGIAYKQGIVVTFVQPHYTSQTCRECGSITKSNRKTQEVFSCCSTLNADLNSSYNIEDRVLNIELKSALLKKNKLGELKPKKLRKEVIKDIVGSAYACD